MVVELGFASPTTQDHQLSSLDCFQQGVHVKNDHVEVDIAGTVVRSRFAHGVNQHFDVDSCNADLSLDCVRPSTCRSGDNRGPLGHFQFHDFFYSQTLFVPQSVMLSPDNFSAIICVLGVVKRLFTHTM